jgi:hypothetical protein
MESFARNIADIHVLRKSMNKTEILCSSLASHLKPTSIGSGEQYLILTLYIPAPVYSTCVPATHSNE